MATITGTIKSLRQSQLAELNSYLAAADALEAELTDKDRVEVAKLKEMHAKFLENIASDVYSIAEISYAKKVLKKENFKKDAKRF